MVAGCGPAPDGRMAGAFPTAQVSVGGRLRNGRVRCTARHAAAREVVRLEGCPQPHPAASVPSTVPRSASTLRRSAEHGDAQHPARCSDSSTLQRQLRARCSDSAKHSTATAPSTLRRQRQALCSVSWDYGVAAAPSTAAGFVPSEELMRELVRSSGVVPSPLERATGSGNRFVFAQALLCVLRGH